MDTQTIAKVRQAWSVVPNLLDYEEECRAFSWDLVRRELAGLPGGALNIAHEAVDRHAEGPLADRVAIRWIGRSSHRRDLRFGELRDETNRFANVLKALGVQKGDRVFTLLGRVPELYIAALGTLKLGAVLCPLFSAFGPEPIRQRLTRGDGAVAEGEFHETMNLTSLWKLPLFFACENNLYAMGTAIERA